MTRIRTVAAALLLAIVTTIAGALAMTPSIAALPTSSAAVAPSVNRPCGRPHYPPCPPPHHVGIGKHRVHRGHRVWIHVSHYPAHTRVIVHIGGKRVWRQIGSGYTGRKGNFNIDSLIPKHIPAGWYTIWVRVGSTLSHFRVHVLK
jgi:hypothetical protein